MTRHHYIIEFSVRDHFRPVRTAASVLVTENMNGADILSSLEHQAIAHCKKVFGKLPVKTTLEFHLIAHVHTTNR